MKAGVVGWPVAHSLSPLIHSAWIAAAGLEAVYKAFGPEDSEAFARLVDQGRAGMLRGLNVTAPYKLDALRLVDTATQTARRAGSANLIVFDGGKVHADSTDGAGLIAALTQQAPQLDLTAGPTLILGAGGAARAAVAALLDAGSPRVIIRNRTISRAEALAADLGEGVTTSGDLGDVVLVVNAVGGAPDHDFADTPSAQAAMDMTYRPLMTDFLKAAAGAGAAPVDGLAMLIGQARPSFQALFGVAPPEVDVRALAEAALAQGDAA